MSLTKVSYSMIKGARINVLDYGADNTGTTPCAAAIQAAIEASKALAGYVYFPAGNYKIEATLNIDGARLLGDLASITWAGVAGATMMTANTLYFGLFQINLNGANIAARGLHCGAVTALGRNVSFGSIIWCCEFNQFTSVCLDNAGSGAGFGLDAVDMRIELSAFRNSPIGLILYQPDHTVHACYITSCDQSLIVGGNSGVNLTNTLFIGKTGVTKHLVFGSTSNGQVNFTQCWFENGSVMGYLSPGTNSSRCASLTFTDCHISYEKSKSGSDYVVDLYPLNSGNIAFINCYFDRTTDQSVRFGNCGGTIINSAFRDIGATDNQAVRYVEFTSGSVVTVGSNGLGGARPITTGYIKPNTGNALTFQNAAGNDQFGILPTGDFLVTTQAVGSFPNTTAVLLDTSYRQAFAYIWGQEAGSNLSVGLYSLLYNGTTWTISQVHRQAVGNGNGTVSPSINGNYISLSNVNGNALGSWRVKVMYMFPV